MSEPAGDERSGEEQADRAATIVRMTVEHVGALMPFEREMFGAEAWSRSSYLAELADTQRRYYIAAEDPAGGLLGWAGVLIVAESAEILTVGVVPAARRAGIGRRLLETLLAAAADRGAREAFLEVRVDNPGAQALYLGAGFAVMGRRRGYYDGGRVDAVTMRSDLAGP